MSFAVAAAIGDMTDATLVAQTQAALLGLALANPIVILSEVYAEAQEYYALLYSEAVIASVMSPTPQYDPGGNPNLGQGPQMAAVAASDNSEKDILTQASNLNIGALQNILEGIKSNVASLGNNLDQVFQFESPIIQIFSLVTSLIQGLN